MEDLKQFKNELQYIINSNEQLGQANLVKAAQNFLRANLPSGSATKDENKDRTKEERTLADFADSHSLWVKEESLGLYVTEGAEQKIFFSDQSKKVIKLADGIFYTCWLDYFNNVLLHNTFFPSTAYELIGFLRKDNKLLVVIEQPFVSVTEMTDLENVKLFLLANGFINKKNNDYYHPYLGIILEDLHDENVLTSKGVLFFVDTVFYITDNFFE